MPPVNNGADSASPSQNIFLRCAGERLSQGRGPRCATIAKSDAHRLRCAPKLDAASKNQCRILGALRSNEIKISDAYRKRAWLGDQVV